MPEIPNPVILEVVIPPLDHPDEDKHLHGCNSPLKELKVEPVIYNKYCYSEMNGGG